MKSLSRIFARYLMTGILIVLATLFLNFFLYLLYGYHLVRTTDTMVREHRQIAEELREEDGLLILSQEGYDRLRKSYCWAMLLDDQGTPVWNWELPQELDHTYTPSQVAAFSRWYLEDYPVTVWVTDYGLLVLAQPQGSVWKYNISESMTVIGQLPNFFSFIFMGNLIFVPLLCLFLGASFYRSLKSVALGVEQLSQQKAIRLPQKGMTELLAKQLNQTSAILEDQKEKLQKRDNARTEWISGVSHDIRTPLSLIIGYASALKEDASLSPDQQKHAVLIQQQSLQIKRLIEDLNLTSKLEYHMQPLRLEQIKPGAMLRKLVSDFYNQGLTERHTIDLDVDPAVEQTEFSGDRNLLERAFRNLIQNSIRHNPEGCQISVSACLDKDRLSFQVSDNGCGIPAEIIRSLTEKTSIPESLQGKEPDSQDSKKAPHIMGLRIVKQIFEAHGWEMVFTDERTIQITTCPR